MTCPEARDQLSALLDDALAESERSPVERHLAGCAECQREMERLRRTIGFLRAVERPLAPVGFVDDVLRATRPWYRRAVSAVFVPLSIKLPLEALTLAMVAVLGIQIVRRAPEVRLEVSALGRAREEQQVGPTTGARLSARMDEPPRSGAASGPAAYEPAAAAPPSPVPARPDEPGAGAQAPAGVAKPGARVLLPLGERANTEARALFKDREAADSARPADARQDTPGLKPAPPAETADDSAARPVAERGPRALSGKEAPAGAVPRPSRDVAARPLEGVPDAARRGIAPGAAPLAPGVRPGAPLPGCCVRGTLAVADRARAVRQLGELTQRLGGTEVARRESAKATVVEVTVERNAYPPLIEGLRGLGRLTVDPSADTLAATVRVSVAIVE